MHLGRLGGVGGFRRIYFCGAWFYLVGLPLEGEGFVLLELTEGGGGEAGLHLNDGTDLVVLAAVGFEGTESADDAHGDGFFGFGIEEAAEEFGGSAFGHPAEEGSVDDRLAELFDEIEYEGGFAGAVGMDESGEGFEAGVHDGTPDMGGEDAIAVVEGRVYGGVDDVGGRVVSTKSAGVDTGDEVEDGGPVESAGGTFETLEGGADGAAIGSFDEEDFLGDLFNREGGGFELFALFVGAGSGEVLEEFGLVAGFAGDDPAGHVGTDGGIDGVDLGFAGFDGGGEEGGGEESVGASGSAEEGEADAAFAEGFDHVGGDVDTAGADDDFLEAEEGDLGDYFSFMADGDAFGLFAEGEAEAGDEELGAGFGNEEADLIVVGRVDFRGKGEIEEELFGGFFEALADPVVLGGLGWLAFKGAGFGEAGEDGPEGPGGGGGHVKLQVDSFIGFVDTK